jgi:single-strand DNA-binding protein
MVNKIILMGHVGKDPVIRHLDNNLVKAEFSLATSERWTNKDGSKAEHTEWFNIVMWRNLAETAEKYVRKGSLLYLEGKVNTRSYDDRDGNKRFVMEVTADTLKLVGPKPDSGQTSGGVLEESAPVAE